MEKNEKTTKYLTILALLVAIFSISFGFAAYTQSINISAVSDVTVKTPARQGGVLSLSGDKISTGFVKPSTSDGVKAEEAILTKDTISNISAHFTKPGQSVTYSFYGYNDSEANTYLNSVVFGTKTCKASDGEMTQKVRKACDSIKITIKIGSKTFTGTEVDLKDYVISGEGNEKIVVKIEYVSGGAVSNKSFKVNFGTTVLTFSTVD